MAVDMGTAVTTEANPVEEMVGRLFMEGVGTMHVMSVYLGVKLGLFRALTDGGPQTAAQLAEATGRAKSNLSRTLKTMERYGLVRFEKGKGRTLVPRTPYTDVVLDLSLRTRRSARRTLVPA